MMGIGLRRAAAQACAALTIGLAASVFAALPARAISEDPVVLSFAGGATFFSQTARTERAIDPQVFVYDRAVAVGTGPERIEHIAGLRNARLDDPQLAPIYNAEGMALGLTLR